MPAAVWKNLQCLQSIDGEIVLAFFKRVPELWARFALHMPGEKLYNGKMDEKIRINKYLSEAGFCSRREADSLIPERTGDGGRSCGRTGRKDYNRYSCICGW